MKITCCNTSQREEARHSDDAALSDLGLLCFYPQCYEARAAHQLWSVLIHFEFCLVCVQIVYNRRTAPKKLNQYVQQGVAQTSLTHWMNVFPAVYQKNLKQITQAQMHWFSKQKPSKRIFMARPSVLNASAQTGCNNLFIAEVWQAVDSGLDFQISETLIAFRSYQGVSGWFSKLATFCAFWLVTITTTLAGLRAAEFHWHA